jgi:putative oxidoreductase
MIPTAAKAETTAARGATVLAALDRVPLALLQLLFRLAIVGVFLRAGLQKLESWESTVTLFANEYKVPVLPPEVAAVMATAVEVGGSLLLLAGLATRLTTLPFLGQLAVIQLFVYPQAWPEHLVWGSILLFLLVRGPGPISLDHALARWLGAR